MQVNRLKTKTKISGFKTFYVERVELMKSPSGKIKMKIFQDYEGVDIEFTHEELQAIMYELSVLQNKDKPKEHIPEGYCRDRRGGIRQLGTYDG